MPSRTGVASPRMRSGAGDGEFDEGGPTFRHTCRHGHAVRTRQRSTQYHGGITPAKMSDPLPQQLTMSVMRDIACVNRHGRFAPPEGALFFRADIESDSGGHIALILPQCP
jgi:hypothetical protein